MRWNITLAIFGIILGTAIPRFFDGEVWQGIAGIIGPILCYFGAGGMRGSLLVGTPKQRFWGTFAGLVFLAGATAMLVRSKFEIIAFGYHLPGWQWGLLVFLTTFLLTKKEDALP